MSAGVATSVASAEARPQGGHRLLTMLLLVTAPILALDQLSKLYITSHLRLYQTVGLIPHWLDLTYTLNPGAAFSLFATMPPGFRDVFFLTVSAVAIAVLLWLLARRSPGPLTNSIAFALILGGTIGNLIDRIARGRVVDFIYFHHRFVYPIHYDFSYAIFNVADSAITIGVIIILVFNILAAPSEERRTTG
ncbi:MAG: signal peptidase II [Candidatus Binataceae bacterium]